MTPARRTLVNSGIMLAAQLVTWTASLMLTAALGRSLGSVGFGSLYVAMSLCAIFGVLVDFGLDQQLVRAVARQHELASTYLVNSITIRLLLATVAYAGVLLVSAYLGYSEELRWIIGVYCLVLFLNGASASLTAVYQAIQSVLHAAVATVFEKCAIAALALVMLGTGHGTLAVACVFVAGAVLGLAWRGVFIVKRIPHWSAPERRTLKMLVVGALPFFLYWALGSVYYRIDVILLTKLTAPAVVGWYGAAYRLFDTLVFLPGIVSSAVLFPIIARLSLRPRVELRGAVQRGLRIMVIVGLPICTGLLVLADPIIRFVYARPDFSAAGPALQWLSIGLLVLYINSVLGVVLMSLHRERSLTLVAGLATLVNFSLNWLLIPRFQQVAAAAVTSATEVLILGCLLYLMPKELLAWNLLPVLCKAGISAAIMAMCLIAFNSLGLPLLVPLGAITYLVAGGLLRVVPPEDLRLLQVALLPTPVGKPSRAAEPTPLSTL
jgi:O-antigen/teichoic acid export membrane protein